MNFTVLMVRSNWPALICGVAGLHAWEEGVAALTCSWCGDFIVYEDCKSYQTWTRYWFALLADPVARLN